ncbi:hypothetical protein ACFPOE_13155 [Caenimonas terrae]|uniref:Uncharacterized protein n=1 Tax=Caenimonas terrae TaxID=696074 RepID=A0ABW0NGR5_9BURK
MYQAYQATAQRTDTSIDASDDYVEPDASRYCPTDLLGTFTLLMAGQGRCVSADMMLGDREYAMWQLARAHAMADDHLRSVAVRLFSYFDDPRGWGTALHA